MFFGAIDKQAWVPERQWSASEHGVNRETANILTVAGSLTRFLERTYGMELEVELHEQFLDTASTAEAALLLSNSDAPVLRRRVSLMHREQLMFDAESLLPLEPLPQELVKDLQDGERPLANLLMDYGLSLSRMDLGICRIQGDAPWHDCWSRRSVLRSQSDIEALVVEVFRPAFWQRLEKLKQRHRNRVG